MAATRSPQGIADPAAPGTTPPARPPSAAAAADVPGAQALPVPGAAVAREPDPGLRPVRLAAPSVGIDTALIDLGIAPDGTMEVPTDYQVAGWLDASPLPGQRGPAVLAGHVDSRTGPAVFFRLDELTAGARVVVTRADGREVVFVVDGVERYAKDAFPSTAVYGPVPGPVLRLITCGGTFDRSTGHYRDNVVVFATALGA